MATKKKTLGSVTDEMFDLREQRRKIAAEDKILKAAYDTLETLLIDMLEKENTKNCTGRKAGASVSQGFAFSFTGDTGFETFMAFVGKHKYYHLVQRRVSAAAVEELFSTKGSVPGVTATATKAINLRVV